MAAAASAPKRPRKQTSRPRKPAAAAGTAAAAPAPAGQPVAGQDRRPINEWLHDEVLTPKRIEVFDRWWEFKQPTGGRAEAWDRLLAAKGIRYALASMMFDEAASPEVRVPGPGGAEIVLEAVPGSAGADEFIAAATEWVPPQAAEEFWRRMEVAIFGTGEASAS